MTTLTFYGIIMILARRMTEYKYSIRYRCPKCKRSNILIFDAESKQVTWKLLKYNKVEKEKSIDVSGAGTKPWEELLEGEAKTTKCYCEHQFMIRLAKPLELLNSRLERKRIV